MSKIRVTNVPADLDPQDFAGLVGMEFPVAPEKDVLDAAFQSGIHREEIDGLPVNIEDVVMSLRANGSEHIAASLQHPRAPRFLVFPSDCYTEIPSQ